MAEFGKCVLFRPPKTQHEKRHKKVLAGRAVDGVWLGTDIKTSANIVAMADGVFFTGRILRKAPGDRWSRKAIDDFVGAHKNPRQDEVAPSRTLSGPSYEEKIDLNLFRRPCRRCRRRLECCRCLSARPM